MDKSNTRNMTDGNAMKLIIRFAIPLLFGILFQQVYSMVDTMIVGRILGVDALAAVGATGSISFLIMGFCMGVCNGFAIPVAQCFGAQDMERLKKTVGNSAVLATGISLIMMSITVIYCKEILAMMRTPENIFETSASYIRIIFAGIPTTALYNILSSYLRSLGDSKTPLYFLIISSLLNIVLDLLFILKFGLGVAGAAYATVISQAVSGILCFIHIVRKISILHIRRSDLIPEKETLKNLLVMGVPMGLQFTITAIGSIVLQTSINGLGSGAVASMTAASKLDMFGQAPFQALGSAMATFAGQNVGARKYDRLKKGLFNTSLLGAGYSLIILLVYIVSAKNFLYLFIDASETVVIEQARQCIVTYGIFYIPLALVNIVRFTIQGMGYSGIAIFAGVAEMVGRSLAGIFLVPIFGFTGATLAGPLAWVLADIFLISAFFGCLNHLKKTNA